MTFTFFFYQQTSSKLFQQLQFGGFTFWVFESWNYTDILVATAQIYGTRLGEICELMMGLSWNYIKPTKDWNHVKYEYKNKDFPQNRRINQGRGFTKIFPKNHWKLRAICLSHQSGLISS